MGHSRNATVRISQYTKRVGRTFPIVDNGVPGWREEAQDSLETAGRSETRSAQTTGPRNKPGLAARRGHACARNAWRLLRKKMGDDAGGNADIARAKQIKPDIE
jgi:hypothetical protein